MPTKIKRSDALTQYPHLPRDNRTKEEAQAQPAYGSGTLTLSAKSVKGHIKTLSLSLTKLMQDLGFDGLIFLGDNKTPWLHQDSDYKPVKAALQYLGDNKVGKRFNGALKADILELAVFIPHLCWLIRCNASLPIFHFTDSEQNFIGSICQYGNIHYYTLNEKTQVQLERSMEGNKLTHLMDSGCNEQYSTTGAIRNRQISL